MKKTMRLPLLFALMAGLLCLGVMMSGCTGQQPPAKEPSQPPTALPTSTQGTPAPTGVSPAATTQPATTTVATTSSQGGTGQVQKLSITGSTTVLPIAQKAAEELMKKNDKLDVQVSGGGSGVGVQAAGEGTADIGMSSRDIKADELKKYPQIQTITIAQDGIAVIVNPANPVDDLSLSEIQDIFSGQFNNWKQIGGSDQPIVVVGRDSASGTREFFTSAIMKDRKYVSTQLEKNSNGAVKQTIAQTPGAIGYVSIGFVDATVKPVGIEVNKTAVQPTVANVKSKAYPVSRDLYLLTRGQPSPVEKTFIDYVLSAEGQKLVQDEGYVPVSI